MIAERLAQFKAAHLARQDTLGIEVEARKKGGFKIEWRTKWFKALNSREREDIDWLEPEEKERLAKAGTQLIAAVSNEEVVGHEII